MQIILASAKIMREKTDVLPPFTTTPIFEQEAEHFAMELAQMDVEQLAKQLHCSNSIALENQHRFANFFVEEDKMPAVLAYFGQAYKYLKADDFSADDFIFAQKHLNILSFLYGILRPLDNIHTYRLEGKVRLDSAGGKNLFAWWKDKLTDQLIKRVKDDDGILLHLATEEFEHLFDWKKVKEHVRVVKPLFYVDKGDVFKIVSMYAKGCRGAMARFVITNRISDVDTLHHFTVDGFTFQQQLGDRDNLIFVQR